MDKIAVVTGAAGFAGCNLTEHLLEYGYKVYAVVRPQSIHNERLNASDKLIKIECDSSEYYKLPNMISEKCHLFFHFTWMGGRDDFVVQSFSQKVTLDVLRAASEIGCSRFVSAGSQAEYGLCKELITEDTLPKPINAYGTFKLATMYETKCLAEQLGIEWIWGRIFSVYGKYEDSGRMLASVITKMKKNEPIYLSSCTQYWDYIDAGDLAEAFISLAERGCSGEIYNVANGGFRPLKDFIEEAHEILGSSSEIIYGNEASPYVSLKPSIDKIMRDTGWKPSVTFCDGITKAAKGCL